MANYTPVYSTGKNDYGELGLGTTGNKNTFQLIDYFKTNKIQIKDRYNNLINPLDLTKNKCYIWSTGKSTYGENGIAIGNVSFFNRLTDQNLVGIVPFDGFITIAPDTKTGMFNGYTSSGDPQTYYYQTTFTYTTLSSTRNVVNYV